MTAVICHAPVYGATDVPLLTQLYLDIWSLKGSETRLSWSDMWKMMTCLIWWRRIWLKKSLSAYSIIDRPQYVIHQNQVILRALFKTYTMAQSVILMQSSGQICKQRSAVGGCQLKHLVNCFMIWEFSHFQSVIFLPLCQNFGGKLWCQKSTAPDWCLV